MTGDDESKGNLIFSFFLGARGPSHRVRLVFSSTHSASSKPQPWVAVLGNVGKLADLVPALWQRVRFRSSQARWAERGSTRAAATTSGRPGRRRSERP